MSQTLAWVQGGTTLLIALFGAFIAWRQVRNAEYKTRLDLYDRRYAIYQKVIEETSKVLKRLEGRQHVWQNVIDLESNATFLFDVSVTSLIGRIATAAERLEEELSKEEERFRTTADAAETASSIKFFIEAFTDQERHALVALIGQMTQAMMPYLDFRKVDHTDFMQPIRVVYAKIKAEMDRTP